MDMEAALQALGLSASTPSESSAGSGTVVAASAVADSGAASPMTEEGGDVDRLLQQDEP